MDPLLDAPHRTPPPHSTDPPAPAEKLEQSLRAADRDVPLALCAAWSSHAAELAVPLGTALEHWEETPATDRLVAEGYLLRLLPGVFLPPDVLHSAVDRALAVGCALGVHLQAQHVIAGPSAAWVVLGGEPPEQVELLSSAHRGDLAGVVLRHSRLLPEDIETVGGAPVTVPVRTALDLLRFTPSWIAEPALRRLVEGGHARLEEIRHRLHAMHRYPGVLAARQRLEQMLDPQLVASGAPSPTGLPSAVTR